MPTPTAGRTTRVRITVKGFSWKAPGDLSPLVKLLTGNQNFAPVDGAAARRRLTLAESIARNKIRYRSTLERLS